MSDAKVIEEMMADAMLEIRKRMGLMKELAAENKSLYQRFVAWIREAMDTLRDFFHSNPTGLSTEQVDLMHEKFADLVRDIHGLHNEAIIKVANTPDRTFTLPGGEPLINYSRNVEKTLDNSDNLEDNVGVKEGRVSLADRYSKDEKVKINKIFDKLTANAQPLINKNNAPDVNCEHIVKDLVSLRNDSLKDYLSQKTGDAFDDLVKHQMLLDYARELIKNERADSIFRQGIEGDRGEVSDRTGGYNDGESSTEGQRTADQNSKGKPPRPSHAVIGKVPRNYDTHDNDKLIKYIRYNGYAKHSDYQGALPILPDERVGKPFEHDGKYYVTVNTVRLTDEQINNLHTLASNNDAVMILQGGVKETLNFIFGNNQQGERFRNEAIAYLDENASLSAKGTVDSLDVEYFSAIRDMENAKTDAERETARQELVKMVEQKAKDAGFENAIPEQTLAYATRTKAAPKKTKKVYKVFTVTDDGVPTALFVSSKEELPQNVWLDAKDTFHFKDNSNGLYYIPSTKNPSTKGGKTYSRLVDLSNVDKEDVKKLVEMGEQPHYRYTPFRGF